MSHVWDENWKKSLGTENLSRIRDESWKKQIGTKNSSHLWDGNWKIVTRDQEFVPTLGRKLKLNKTEQFLPQFKLSSSDFKHFLRFFCCELRFLRRFYRFHEFLHQFSLPYSQFQRLRDELLRRFYEFCFNLRKNWQFWPRLTSFWGKNQDIEKITSILGIIGL